MYERGKEHWRGFRSKAEDSHIHKHHQIHHGGEGEPKFHLRPVKFHQTALTRQIHEAVRIQRWGEDIILNSRSEFNRCKIGRLTIGENQEPRMKNSTEIGLVEDEGGEDGGEQRIKDWRGRGYRQGEPRRSGGRGT